MTRSFWQLSVVLGLLACASAASAQTRVVVREFDGPFATRARSGVVDGLQEHSVEVVDESDAKAAGDLDTEAGRAAIARELAIAGFIEGHTSRSGSSRAKLQLTLYSGQDGSQVSDSTLVAPKPKLEKLSGVRVWKAFGEALASAKPSAPEPAAKTPEPEPIDEPEPVASARDERREEPEPAEDADDDDDGAKPTSSPFDLSVGARIGTRRFTYNDAFPGLRGYKLGLSPNVALRLHWYPGAHFSDGVAANLGLELRGELMVGVSSKNSAGQKFDTSSRELGFGLRWRNPFGEASEWGLLLGYGMRSFEIEQAKAGGPGVPAVDYGFLRIGGDARLSLFGPLSFDARAAFLLGLSQGEIADKAWFPHTSQHGVEAEAGLGFALSDGLEAQAVFVLQRFFMSFDPRINDAAVQSDGRVAGGALDQYLSGRLALVWRL
jgi:hypothetical protein